MLTNDDITYLKSLNSTFDYNNLSYEDKEELEKILADRLISTLIPPNYESSDESIICQNILDKLFD